MAKGRKLTTSRSERLLGSHSQVSNGVDLSELGEEDVWSMVDNMTAESNNSQGEWSPRASGESNGSVWARSTRQQRRIPRDDRQVGGLSLAFDDSESGTSSSRIVHQFRGNEDVSGVTPRQRHMATSAPVNVPDWSKILRVDSVDSLHELDPQFDDDRDSEMVPPHEYLAREYARSRKIAATSVFEGVGRTLKGRDMSRSRDAVWSQTGFDG
jgi:hypothetical protein